MPWGQKKSEALPEGGRLLKERGQGGVGCPRRVATGVVARGSIVARIHEAGVTRKGVEARAAAGAGGARALRTVYG